MRSASSVLITPIWLPSSSIRRTSATRILSLIRVGSRSGGCRSNRRGTGTRKSRLRGASSYLRSVRGRERAGNEGTGRHYPWRRRLRVPFIGFEYRGVSRSGGEAGVRSPLSGKRRRELVERHRTEIAALVRAHRGGALLGLAV